MEFAVSKFPRMMDMLLLRLVSGMSATHLRISILTVRLAMLSENYANIAADQ